LAQVLPFAEVMARRFQTESQDMDQSQALAYQGHGSESGAYVELWQSLRSQIEAISPFLDQLMRCLKRFRDEDGIEVDIEIAVREALTNAVVHGNREDPNKLVFVTSRCSANGEVSITVCDEGQGFDSRAVPDPTAPENVLSSHGRGIYVMQKLMDEVSFEQNGTVLKMRKRPNKKVNAERKPD
jgi:serine/threonine-protein kinase RsbW